MLTNILKRGLICGIAALWSGIVSAQSLNDHFDAYWQAPDDSSRTAAFYTFSADLRRGRLVLEKGQGEELSRFLARVMLSETAGHERIAAAGHLEHYPHVGVGEELLAYLQEKPHDPLRVAEQVRRILARLGHEGVLPYLRVRLKEPSPRVVREAVGQLAESRNPVVLPDLEDLLADEDLAGRFARSYGQRRATHGNTTDEMVARNHGAREAEQVRAAARLAIRRIKLWADFRIDCGFDLQEGALRELRARGFVILPQPTHEMFEWYSEEYPFVTTDFVYHTWMALVRAACQALEETVLKERLGRVCVGMARGCEGSNAAWYALAADLLGAADPADLGLEPTLLADLRQERRLINAGAGVALSPLLGQRVDYSEYRPIADVGQRDPAWRQALIWLGLATIRAEQRDSIERMVAATRAFYSDPEIVGDWEALQEVLLWLGGPADDLDFQDILLAAEKVTGITGPAALEAVQLRTDGLQRMRRSLRGMPAIQSSVQGPRSRQWGLPLLGGRYARDAHHFQALMEGGIWPLSGLHMAAGVLGSERAAHHLGAEVPGAPPRRTDAELSFMGHFETAFRGILSAQPPALEPFASEAWQDKMLNTALGAWAETRHALSPYVKEAHYYAGSSMVDDRVHGFVEPYPDFFTTMAARARLLHRHLEDWGVFAELEARRRSGEARLDSLFGGGGDQDRQTSARTLQSWQTRYREELACNILDASRLLDFAAINERLAELASQGLAGSPQSEDDGLFLKSLAERMRRLAFHESNLPHAENSMARVVDAAREYESAEALWVGVGRALPLYVTVAGEDGRVVCRGAIYSYYEGVQDLGPSLEDTRWQAESMTMETSLGEPWIDAVAGLVHHAELGRAQLLELENRWALPGDHVNSRYKWVAAGYRQNAWPVWVGARTAPEDTDILVRIAEKSHGSPGLRLMALAELARHRARPEVRAFFRQRVASLVAKATRTYPDHLPWKWQAEVHYGLRALGSSPEPEDRKLVRALLAHLARIPPGRRREPDGWEALQSIHLAGPSLPYGR